MISNRLFLMGGVLMSVALAIGGCSKQGLDGEVPGKASTAGCPGSQPVRGKTGWVQCPEVTSTDGSVHLQRQVMDPDEQEKTRQRYQRTNLLALPVDAKYNADIFQINGPPEYAHKAFIAPRIFAYGSQDGGSRTSPKQNTDGTVTVSFNVIFVDGLSATIPGADGRTAIPLPGNFQVNDADGLRQSLKDLYQATNGLAPIPGCPKRIIVKIADQEYDATASSLAASDNCQINIPTVVSVRLHQKDAQYMLEDALYDDLVDVQATYETRVSFPVANISVSFDRQRIYSDLQAELGVKIGWVESDLRTHITHVMQNQLLKVSIQGDMDDALEKLVRRVTEEFFVPFKPDPSDAANECSGTAAICLRLSYNASNQSDTLSFTWNQSSNAETNQNYLTSTKLSPIENAVLVGSQQSTCSGDPQKCSDLSNRPGVAKETGLTVVSGNLLVVQPNFVVKENRSGAQSDPVRAHNPVCTQTVHHPERCQSRGGECSDAWDQCVHNEDRWVDTISYYNGDPSWQVIDKPIGMLQQLLDGLVARFIWKDSASGASKSVDCPLNLFNRLGDGKSLQVRLENVPTCQPFTGNPDEIPMLYLVNDIQFAEQYLIGKRVARWDGSVLENPTPAIYSPEVFFAGTVSIRGYAFEGVSSDVGNFQK